jgi:hypothetical protein
VLVFVAGGLQASGYPVDWLYAIGASLGIYGLRKALPK